MALGLDATQTLDAASGAITIGGVISGAGGITKTGAQMVTLSGANTYTGETTVSAGILKAGVASVANVSGAFGNNSAVTLANASGAALDITGFNTQIGSLTGGGASGGNVTLGAATLTVGGNNTSPAAYAGVISGTGGGVTKIGTGIQIFSAANTYTGATTVSAGSLFLNNTTGSATGSGTVSVQSGGTLGGSGTASGATTISGSLSPGNVNPNNLAVLSFGSSLSLQSTATTLMEIAGATRGTQYDGVNVGGALTYGGALGINFGTTFVTSQTFNLFNFNTQSGSFTTVSLTGSYTGSLVNNGSGVWALTSGSNTWAFTQSTGNLSLTVIPEPRAALIGGLGVLLLLRRRRD
jgi:autotransporter-associated beta strand protein